MIYRYLHNIYLLIDIIHLFLLLFLLHHIAYHIYILSYDIGVHALFSSGSVCTKQNVKRIIIFVID